MVMVPHAVFLWFVQILIAISLFPDFICAEISQSCNWKGSGQSSLNNSPAKEKDISVRPVYLSCDEGSISWTHPTGALFVHHTLPFGSRDASNTGVEFCIRLHSSHNEVIVYKRENASLKVLFGKKKSSDPLCFNSNSSSITLFLELPPKPAKSQLSSNEERGGKDKLKEAAAFYFFSIQPLKDSSEGIKDPCKPCDTDELLNAYCSSSFIFKGSLLKREGKFLQKTENSLSFLIEKLIQRPIERDLIHRQRYAKRLRNIGSLGVSGSCPMDLASVSEDEEYLIVGKVSLGRSLLHCGILWSDWERILASLRRRPTTLSAPCEIPLS